MWLTANDTLFHMMQRFLAWLTVLCLIIALGAFVLRKFFSLGGCPIS